MKSYLLAFLTALFVPAFSAAGVFTLAKVLSGNAVKTLAPPGENHHDVAPMPQRLPANEIVTQGRNLYVQSCARCHGNDAKGNGEDDDGPDLHGLRMSDARISSVVLKGVKGEMPSFAKKFSTTDVSLLIAYLRSLPAD